MERVGDMDTENKPEFLSVRIAQAFARVHPSMYDLMVWRMNQNTFDAICRIFPEFKYDTSIQVHFLGIPIEIVDSDEILLVLKV